MENYKNGAPGTFFLLLFCFCFLAPPIHQGRCVFSNAAVTHDLDKQIHKNKNTKKNNNYADIILHVDQTRN